MATSFWNLISNYKVVVPIIQRDYAQGRNTGKVPTIRENILNALFSSIEKNDKVLELDFIYGYTKTQDNNDDSIQEVFYPLDGQQRLTTLFLLHWFLAAKEGKLSEARETLSRFTYEIRHSSRIFCSELVKYTPESLSVPIKHSIVNQPWFFTAWSNDPTIDSMLTMLQAIQDKTEKFEVLDGWSRLTSQNAPIVFHLLPTDKLGMPDELYIKMNSRGKELTDFEYFKIRFSEVLKNERRDEFNRKIDQQWSDLFWDLYKRDGVSDLAQRVDNAFLRFFRYICDMLAAKNEIEWDENSSEFDLFEKIYSDERNVSFLFQILDYLSDNKPNSNFFSSLFYIKQSDFESKKTRIFFNRPSVDLFKKCADAYDKSQRNNPFSIGEQLLLYACVMHLLNNTTDFEKRIRKIRNLVANSEDTVRKENLTSLLNSVEEITETGNLSMDHKFSRTQVNEENQKKKFLDQNYVMLEAINLLEDHHLLQGCTAIFEMTPKLDKFTGKFYEVFAPGCNYLDISRALFTIGDYAQKTSWTRLIGNLQDTTWRDLFTPSTRREDFQKTKEVLNELLSELLRYPSSSVESIIDNYLSSYSLEPDKEKGWNYYFIKYEGFRNHTDGYYYWEDLSKPYESVMIRRKTIGGFHWDPVLFTLNQLIDKRVSLESYGKPLIYVKDNISIQITNYNDGYRFTGMDIESEDFLLKFYKAGLLTSEFSCKIDKSLNGMDVEDRIQRGIGILSEFDKHNHS